MILYIDNRDGDLDLPEGADQDLQALLGQALTYEGFDPSKCEISLSFVGGDEIHQLNRTYRGVDQETDVLSFPTYEKEDLEKFKGQDQALILGDIVINMDRVRDQAEENGHSNREEVAYLATHSLLHLLGYDHMEAGEKKEMRAHEEAILQGAGLEREGQTDFDLSGQVLDLDEEDLGPAGLDGSYQDLGQVSDNFHSGFCSLVGRTNVGKSTLSNALLGQKVSIISDRVQTTRNTIRVIYTDDRMQVVFLDTPGIQKPRNLLGKAMLKASLKSTDGADLVIFMTDNSPSPGPVDQKVLEKLAGMEGVKKLLVINKVDLIDREKREKLVQTYQALGIFDAILPISAKTGEGLDDLKETIYGLLPLGPLYYPEDMVTDRSERFIITEIIREKCLNNLRQEVPYGVYVEIEDMHYREDRNLADIYATIYVERPAHKGIIIGKQGAMLKKIGSQARKEIETLLGAQANLKLWVKQAPNWRKNSKQIKRFGYDE